MTLQDDRAQPARTDPAARTRVLYIGGFGRSGSTLLELMLGQATDTTILGEVVFLPVNGLRNNELCSCREPFLSCPFWTGVGEQAFGGWSRFDAQQLLADRARVDRNRFVPMLATGRLPADRAAAAERYTSVFRRIYSAAQQLGNAGVVVDSSKHASLAFVLARDPLIDLRIVHLVRDSRGVAHSWSKHVRRPERPDEGTYMARYSPVGSSAYWTAQNSMFHLLAARGASVLRVRYEDLVDDPAALLTRIRDFAGLAPSAEATSFLTDPDRPPRLGHSVSGNPLRFGDTPLRVRRDERWREDMARRDRWIVSTLTAPLALPYGYLRRGRT